MGDVAVIVAVFVLCDSHEQWPWHWSLTVSAVTRCKLLSLQCAWSLLRRGLLQRAPGCNEQIFLQQIWPGVRCNRTLHNRYPVYFTCVYFLHLCLIYCVFHQTNNIVITSFAIISCVIIKQSRNNVPSSFLFPGSLAPRPFFRVMK